MIKKYIHIIFTLLFALALFSCQDSLGTDPNYKSTIFTKDTVIRIDTIVRIDTVKSSDSSEYIFKIDSLIVVRDSLGNVIDSLSQKITDLERRLIAPKVKLKIDSIVTEISYIVLDTLYDSQQQRVISPRKSFVKFLPRQDSINTFRVELDTNLNMNRIWAYYFLVGIRDFNDSTDLREVFLSNSIINLDSTQIYNPINLLDINNTSSLTNHNTSVVDNNNTNISLSTDKIVTVSFMNYTFDSKQRINGVTMLINIELIFQNPKVIHNESNYKFKVSLSFP